MSGYPYGNPAGGYPPQYGTNNSGYPPQYGTNSSGYPPQYGMDNSGYPPYPSNNTYQPVPPPVPVYPNNPSYMPSYGSNAFPTPSNTTYSSMPNNPYAAGGSNNYMPPPQFEAPMPSPTYNQPQQAHESYGNSSYKPSYGQEMPSASSASLYPTLSVSGSTPNYSSGASASSYQAQQQTQSTYLEQSPSTLIASLEQYQGTIVPVANFNADADCKALRQTMQGLGTNERALIDIVVNRSNSQRQQLKTMYKSMYGVDLVKQISGELSGHFRETVAGLFDAPAEFDARSLNNALMASKEGTLREILLTRTNSEIRAIIEAYKRIYNKDLEKEISSRVRGTDFKRILISTVQANRDELTPQQIQQVRQMGMESVIDRNRAREDADSLYKAGAGKLGTDEKTFNAIFSQRSYQHLRAVFEEYQKKYGKDITKVIHSEFSGEIKEAYLVLIACIRDRPSFFAERIHKAVAGLGTDDATLIRVIITRSEIDLVQVKERYQRMYNRSVAQDVSGDTSGDYKRILLSIVK